MNGVCGIGSGGIYAQCAALALIERARIDFEELVVAHLGLLAQPHARIELCHMLQVNLLLIPHRRQQIMYDELVVLG